MYQIMALPTINPTTTDAWKNLQQHFDQVKDLKMKDLFANDANRANNLTIKWEDFYVDFSKNRITEETIKHLLQLAEDCKIKEAINHNLLIHHQSLIYVMEQQGVKRTINIMPLFNN